MTLALNGTLNVSELGGINGESCFPESEQAMRGTFAVLVFSAVLASDLLVALNQDPADAACANKGAPGCPGQVQSVQQLAQAGGERRSEPEERRPEERRPEERRPEERLLKSGAPKK